MPSASLTERLRRNLHLKKHLEELRALTGRVVHADELGSLDQFVAMRQSAQRFVDQPTVACEIPFSERSSERFKRFLQCLTYANPSPIYVVTPRADSCGVLLLSSLNEVRFDFVFKINEEGLLIFVTSDLEDRLLLDFSSTPTGEEIMKVEVQGSNWKKVAY